MAAKWSRTATMALVAGAIAGTAAAQPPRRADEAPHVRVPYADLNLGSVSGRAQLAHRIAAAAGALCGTPPSIRDLAATEAHRACIRTTISTSTPTLEEAARLQAGSEPHLAAAAQ